MQDQGRAPIHPALHAHALNDHQHKRKELCKRHGAFVPRTHAAPTLRRTELNQTSRGRSPRTSPASSCNTCALCCKCPPCRIPRRSALRRHSLPHRTQFGQQEGSPGNPETGHCFARNLKNKPAAQCRKNNRRSDPCESTSISLPPPAADARRRSWHVTSAAVYHAFQRIPVQARPDVTRLLARHIRPR